MKENPRFSDENVYALRFPEKEKIVCKDCVFRAKDIAEGVSGAVLGCCDAYEIKPPSILLDGKECMYYLSEKEEEDQE